MLYDVYFNKTLIVTGGTGFIGTNICKKLIDKNIKFKKIIIFSRDWLKQASLRNKLGDDNRFRWFIGDIRDKNRLSMAMKCVDICIHAAAIKDIVACEFNPFEAVQTNVRGTQNVIESAIENQVKKTILISTDKAQSPINVYGASKLMSEHITRNANYYSANDNIKFSVCRYGNVFNSTGSVFRIWDNLLKQGIKTLPLTDTEMTRFFINHNSSIDFITESLRTMKGGELFIPKLKAFRLTDLVKAMGADYNIIGARKNEKIHEEMIENISSKDAKYMSIDELKEEVKNARINNKADK